MHIQQIYATTTNYKVILLFIYLLLWIRDQHPQKPPDRSPDDIETELK